MIKVKLVGRSNVGLAEMISFAAKGCYQDKEPILGETIDIESNLFKTGHHTTLQHSYYTFFIEGIAVSDVTFGLHLANSFYNSSQRSGRFCGKMFSNPDYNMIEGYIKHHWPKLSSQKVSLAIDFVREGVGIYQDNLTKATEVAKRFIREDRPKANDAYVEANGPKFAQEQLRVFIPTIFPTALTFTVNLSTIVSMFHSAWSPSLKNITRQMADVVLQEAPEFEYMFEREDREEMSVGVRSYQADGIDEKPTAHLKSAGQSSGFINPKPEDIKLVDLLPFLPGCMDNNTQEVKSLVFVSVATMGQDQRHRTVRRGQPTFTGDFYLPPIPRELSLKKEALGVLKKWFALFDNLPESLVCSLAPYGAMVKYEKSASYNALIHEMLKRTCWCTQEEIFHLAVGLRQKVIDREGEKSPLLEAFPPPCVRLGYCTEGKRYCGRDMNKSPFVERRV